MADPTRPLPNLIPQPDGSWIGHTVLTPTSLKTRGLFTLPPSKVVPVIVVPGIMGSNLRAATSPRLRANEVLSPNEPAWRPPNNLRADLNCWRTWQKRDPATRQQILDGGTLEVDKHGDVTLPKEARDFGLGESEARERRWGEVHWDSYGALLCGLHIRLNHTFEMDVLDNVRVLRQHWKAVVDCEPARWGVRSIQKLTDAELEKHADYYYPVYAFGYNWLDCCDESAKRLRERIERIISFWHQGNRVCRKVILVTHSMGGLVARACAKEIPDQILGVIHGVMPALGSPTAYRRIACGTESFSPNNGVKANKEAQFMADILGNKPEFTMPVMATAPGPLQLLPTHLYPQPWMHLCMVSRVNNKDVARDVAHLPAGSPYEFYRDTKSWYRLIDPQLVDPAKKYREGPQAIERAVRQAITSAEQFHREKLAAYYHPHTYAFYGADADHKSFGSVRWLARDPGDGAVFTEANLKEATRAGYGDSGGRRVKVEGKTTVHFVPAYQDSAGDGTVPQQSGAGPKGQVRQLFELRGLNHQSAYKEEAVLLLTQHLIVKMVQELP